MIGSRITFLATGGAPTANVVMDFVRSTWNKDVLFVESYGATEVGGITENNIPMEGVNVKLLDRPDKGFTTKDLPNPRGEILVKTVTTSPGYYHNEEQTKLSFDSDGFFHTGDLGMFDSDNKLYILDRISAIQSLSDGNVFCPNNLETIYQSSSFIRQIFVYGTTSFDFLVALIVPSQELYNHSLQNQEAKTLVLKSLFEIAKQSHLKNHEIIRNVFLCSNEWTVGNGLLNVHFKKIRHRFQSKFKDELENLFEKKEDFFESN
eukprot:Anaeramoba_ignava/a220210_32.p1 GENE.a220210_32~~a220210_32.p1  ORF type:complete len:295 (+),score=96.93 a220210_32:97-885(+)